MATTITALRSTADLSTQRLVVDIADKIALLDPNENPMTLLSKRIGKRVAKQPKVSWLEDVLQPEIDAVNYSTGYASDATGIVVDNSAYFAVGDIVQVFDSYELMKVTSVGTNYIGVVRNYPGVGASVTGYNTALVDNDWLIRMGNANEEGATAPTARSTKETQVDNYTQIFRDPFELTETELNSLMHADQDLPYQIRKRGIEHMRAIEYATWFGIPSAATGSGGKPARTMGGIWYYMKENASAARVVSNATPSKAEFLAWIRDGFRYGSRNKVLFACPILMSAFEAWGIADLQTRPSDGTYGINITRWVSPHGNIAIVNHKMLEGPNPGTVGGWAFLLDMEKIRYVALRNRDTKLLTGRQANDQDSYEAEYLTECSLEFKNPECHSVLYGITGWDA